MERRARNGPRDASGYRRRGRVCASGSVNAETLDVSTASSSSAAPRCDSASERDATLNGRPDRADGAGDVARDDAGDRLGAASSEGAGEAAFDMAGEASLSAACPLRRRTRRTVRRKPEAKTTLDRLGDAVDPFSCSKLDGVLEGRLSGSFDGRFVRRHPPITKSAPAMTRQRMTEIATMTAVARPCGISQPSGDSGELSDAALALDVARLLAAAASNETEFVVVA